MPVDQYGHTDWCVESWLEGRTLVGIITRPNGSIIQVIERIGVIRWWLVDEDVLTGFFHLKLCQIVLELEM